MSKRWLLIVAMLSVVAVGFYAAHGTAESGEVVLAKAKALNEERIQGLIDEMRRSDVDKLAPIDVKPLELPEAGVDVMRVRLEETYDIAGIGKDTIELKGWIAVRHDHTRPGEGEDVLTWNSAVTDTEFVAMELHGESPIFGPVEVTLDKTTPSVGQVGKLCFPFVVGSSLNAAYMPYRQLFKIDPQAANRVQGPAVRFAAQRQPASETPEKGSSLVTGTRARPVIAVIDGVIKAISAKDGKKMMTYYSSAGSNLFFGPTSRGIARGGEEYVRELSRMFDNIKSIEVKRNDDVQVRIAGNLAVASLTGENRVTNAQGQTGTSPWRWTVELEKGKGGQWQITHDHLSFFGDPNRPTEGIRSDEALGAACLANTSVAVYMKKLDLRMRTAEPVHWYSEVETIPPVGYTASVSATPTPMVSNGRPVGTLEHGAVKFREVVRHVPLIDVTRPDLRIASIRTSPAPGR